MAETIYEGKHRIDHWQERALKNARTTHEILGVYAESYKKWDAALNEAYKSLMKKIPQGDKALLKESQRNWIAYRDAEFKFMSLHINRQGGSLANILSVERKVNFIRNRVIELEAYVFIFDSPP